MKRKSREINIFNMSALDLFASALGAFILIAIVLFPFFPNITDKDLRDLLAEAQQKVTELREELSKNQAELAKVKFPHLDLVVVIDVTGSMGDPIAGLKQDVGDMVEVLSRLAPSLAVGVVAFNDRNQTPAVFYEELRKVQVGDANYKLLKQFIDGFQSGDAIGENNDIPEASYQALQVAIDMPWRSDSEEKMIVMVTDAPPYSDRYAATLQLARGFAANGQSVSGVWIGNRPKTNKFLSELATAGGGSFVKSSGSITSSILLALLKAKAKART